MNDDELKALLQHHPSATAPRFSAGFGDRVMRRVSDDTRGRTTRTLDAVLTQYTRRVLPALAAASLMLALWNYIAVRDRASSTFNAVLGVSVVSVASTAPSANGLMNAEAFE